MYIHIHIHTYIYAYIYNIRMYPRRSRLKLSTSSGVFRLQQEAAPRFAPAGGDSPCLAESPGVHFVGSTQGSSINYLGPCYRALKVGIG